ncbi:hypothetical protein [Actinomadura alba]|uniref:Phage gp6-like head-tail connector protein n=1 Tax=Actinomadura alba TaxID=406431 RepID=A0ABR7LHN6_9ACTN|nr:hypothetical protein [Actinomadura alba]MBC6464259.1 hypothetical protein [Actinomadura alba]
MPLVNPYCAVADIRAELSDADSKLSEALIEKAISAASRAVDKHTGRRFWPDPAPTVRAYKTTGCSTVRVHDISTLTGLVVKTDPAGDGSWATTWAASDYQMEPLNADADGGSYAWWDIVSLLGAFPAARRRPSLQVTARFGWSQVPDQVTEATILKAVGLFRRKDAPFGVAGFGEFGAIRITREDADVVDLLAPFRRVVLA